MGALALPVRPHPGWFLGTYLVAVAATLAAAAWRGRRAAAPGADTPAGAGELEALHTAARTMARSADLVATAEQSLEIACRVARMDAGVVFRLDAAAGTLTMIAQHGASPAELVQLRVRPLDGSPLAEAVRGGRMQVMDVTAATAVEPEAASALRHAGRRTEIALPIPAAEATWGVMALMANEPRQFTPTETRLLEAVAAEIGLAVTRASLVAEARDKGRRLETLVRLTRTLTATLALDEVLGRVVGAAVEIFGASQSGLWLLNRDGTGLWMEASAGAARGSGRRYVAVGEEVVGTIAAQRAPLVVADLAGDRRLRNVDRVRVEGLSSFAGVPITLGDRLLGTLTIATLARREFGHEEIDLLNSLADHAAVAIDNARRFEEERTRRAQLAALLEINKKIGAAESTEGLLQAIAEEAARLLDVDNAGFRLVEGGELVLAGLAGTAAQTMLRPRIKRGESFSGRVVREGRTIVADVATVPELIAEHRAADERLGYTAYLGVPLRAGDRIIGALTLRARRPFGARDRELAEAFAGQAAVALQNRRQVEELSVLHGLSRAVTGQLDRQALLDSLRLQLPRVLATDKFVVLLVDDKAGEVEVALRVQDGRIDTESPRRYPRSVGLASVVLETGRPLRTEDYTAECARRGIALPQVGGPPYWLGVPLVASHVVLGVLTVSRHQDVFTDAEERVAASIADLAALALRSARLYEERTRAYGELAAAQEHLVRTEKLRALGEMASGVAHDFNNLLAAILGRAQLLLRRIEEPRLRQWLQVIERSAMDGAQTVRRLQEFARVRRDEPLVPVDLNEIVRDALEITQVRWREESLRRGIPIEVQTQLESVPLVAGDPAELREVMTNLILNAIDAMPDGGTLTLSSATVNEQVEVTVSDTGVGIPSDIHEKIFDPFFTTKGQRGTGLGLSLTYGILSRHGARITVASEEGRGATFRMTFPPLAAPAVPRPSAPVSAPVLGSMRCLVVDDEEAVGAVIGDALEALGHKAVVVTDGAAALDRFRAEPFDAVFTDLAMPGLSGWQVAKAVKEAAPAVPVFVVTGFGVSLSADERRAHGVEAIFAKPLKIEDMMDAMVQVARRRDRPDEREDT